MFRKAGARLGGTVSHRRDVGVTAARGQNVHRQAVRFPSMARGCWFIVLTVLCGGLLRAEEEPVDLYKLGGSAVYSPWPTYYRAWESNSWCKAVMMVDPATGRVTDVRVTERVGDSNFTYHVVETLRSWKFRPGTPRLVRIAFGTQSAWSGEPASERKAMPMDNVLAPFLGKGTLMRGELPDYPAKPAWTNRHGTAVFELHVDRAGRVADVTVKTPSGDEPFDRVTAKAMRRWRFRRGPLIIELPLSFELTSTNFSVHVPKHS